MLISAGSGTWQAQRQLNTSNRLVEIALLKGTTTPTNIAVGLWRTTMNGPFKSSEFKSSFEVKGGAQAASEEWRPSTGARYRCSATMKGWRISANVLNDVLLESQQDQRKMSIFSSGGSAGGESRSVWDGSSRFHRFWSKLGLLSLSRGQNISGNTEPGGIMTQQSQSNAFAPNC